MNFATLKGLTIPEGVVTKIECGGKVLWKLAGEPVIPDEPVVPDTPTATQYLYGHKADSVVTYNGVELPDIESIWDKETYPYAYVLYTDLSDLFSGAWVSTVLFTNAKGVFDYDCVYITNGTNVCSSMITNNAELQSLFGGGLNEWGNVEYETIDSETGGLGYEEPCVWTSHDILNTDGSVYLSASEPVHSYDNPDVIIDGVGYVGAVLPKLPEWDKVAYPYIMIYDAGAAMGYQKQLFASTNKPAYAKELEYSGWNIFFDDITYRLCWSAEEGASEWTIRNFGDKFYGGSSSYGAPFWANFDLLTEDGTLYLAASEPVPVYE